jgi:hypothetical protein
MKMTTKMTTLIQDTFLGTQLPPSSDLTPINSPQHHQVPHTPYPESSNMFTENPYFPQREPSPSDVGEATNSIFHPQSLIAHHHQQQQQLYEKADKYQLYYSHHSSYSTSPDLCANYQIIDPNSCSEKRSNSLNYFNNHCHNSSLTGIRHCHNSSLFGFNHCNNSSGNGFHSLCPDNSAKTLFDQGFNSEENYFSDTYLGRGNIDNITKKNKESHAHFSLNNSMYSKLHDPLFFSIDMANTDCRTPNPNCNENHSFLKICSSGKDYFQELGLKSEIMTTDSEYLLKYESLIDGRHLEEFFDFCEQKDVNEDSGISRGSSITSTVDDNVDSSICLTHSEPDNQYCNASLGDYYSNENDYLKSDYWSNNGNPHNDEVFYDHDFKAPGYYESSPSECASVPHYLLNGSIAETTNVTHRQITDLQHAHSRHGSPMSDEGFYDVPEEKLPIFSQIQHLTDSDRDSQNSHSISTAPAKRKKDVHQTGPQAEKERRKPGRKPGQVSNVLHLWEFIRDLLHSDNSQGVIEWISKQDGVFQVKNSSEVARLWGEKKKNKKKMTYEKLSRSLRYSRLEGYFADLPKDKNYPKKLCFRFGPKSRNWCDKKDIIDPTFSHIPPRVVHMPHHS